MKVNFSKNLYKEEIVACWMLLFCCNMDFLTNALKNSHPACTGLQLGNAGLQSFSCIFSI